MNGPRLSLRLAAWAAGAVLSAACNTSVRVEPEGLLCSALEPCPSGYVCAQGTCRSQLDCARDPTCVPTDRCLGVYCTTPPQAFCADAGILRSFAPSGTCNAQDGTCSYGANDTPCAQGCVNGGCVGDPCAGILCTTPPGPRCLAAGGLRIFSSPGSCAQGSCTYPNGDRSCTHGCDAGQCLNQDLCQGVSCTTVPKPTCVGQSLRSYSAPGSCDGSTGQCSFPFTDTSCAQGCVAGACVPVGLTFSQTMPRVRHAVSAVDQAPGSVGRHVLAVGPGGQISKWDGASWSNVASNTTQALNAVFFSSSTTAWIVGAGRTVLRYSGNAVVPVSLPGTGLPSPLVSVHGQGTELLVADNGANYWRFSGGAWSTGVLYGPLGETLSMASAYVSPLLHLRIAGRCQRGTSALGCVAYKSPSGTGFVVDVDDAAGQPSGGFGAVGPPVGAGALAFAGHVRSPTVRRHDASLLPFDSTNVPTPLQGAGVAAISESASSTGEAVFVLTDPGAVLPGNLYRWVRTGLNPPQFDPPGSLFTVRNPAPSLSRNDSGGVIVADTGTQSASIFRRGAVTSEVLELGESWARASIAPNGALVLMNAHGDLATRPSSTAGFTFRRAPSRAMNDVVAGSTYAVVVGGGGEAYRVTTSYAPIATGSSALALNAVCRASDTEHYAVGSGGAIRAYAGGSSMTSMSSPTTEDLYAVHCGGPGAAVACGANGAVVQLAQGSWSAVSPAFPTTGAKLTTCVLAPGGVVYVGGDNVLAKLEGGAWTTLPAVVSLGGLLFSGPNELYAFAQTDVWRFDGAAWTKKLTAGGFLRGAALGSGYAAFVGQHGVLVEGQ